MLLHDKRAPIEQWKWKGPFENIGMCLVPNKDYMGGAQLADPLAV